MAQYDLDRILVKRILRKTFPNGFKSYWYLMECLVCHRHFKIREGPLNNGNGQTCSHRCSGIYRGMKRRGFKHSPEALKKMSETRRRNPIRNEGPHNHFWRGGRWEDSHGYVRVWSPEHPFKDGKNYVMEHRLIMEKHIGRYLKKTEYVHHKNGKKNDNRIENLEIKTTRAHSGRLVCPYCQKSFQLR